MPHVDCPDGLVETADFDSSQCIAASMQTAAMQVSSSAGQQVTRNLAHSPAGSVFLSTPILPEHTKVASDAANNYQGSTARL